LDRTYDQKVAEVPELERRWAIARDQVEKLEPHVRQLTAERSALAAELVKARELLNRIRAAIAKANAV